MAFSKLLRFTVLGIAFLLSALPSVTRSGVMGNSLVDLSLSYADLSTSYQA